MIKKLRTHFYNFICSEEYSVLTKPEKISNLNHGVLDSICEFEEVFSEELSKNQKEKLSVIVTCFISHNLFLLYSDKISAEANISCHIVNEKEDKISNWELIYTFISLVRDNSPSDLYNDKFLEYFLSVVESFKNDLLQG